MQINIAYGKTINSVLSGFTNVNPFDIGDDTVVITQLDKLDDLVCDGEASQIQALEVLNYVELKKIPSVLSHWVNKLEQGGRLCISFSNAYSIAGGILYKTNNLEKINEQIFGGTQFLMRSIITVDYLCALFTQLNIKTMIKRIDSNTIYVEGVKL